MNLDEQRKKLVKELNEYIKQITARLGNSGINGTRNHCINVPTVPGLSFDTSGA